MKVKELIAEVEGAIHSSEAGFEMEEAELYAVDANHDKQRPLMTLIQTNEDIYRLLVSREAMEAATYADFIAVVTTGWAAPFSEGDEIPQTPSEAKNRRRIRIVILAGSRERGSVIRFEDEQDSPLFQNGLGQGMLADAIEKLFDKS